jgi:hypothetical protein
MQFKLLLTVECSEELLKKINKSAEEVKDDFKECIEAVFIDDEIRGFEILCEDAG